MSCGRKDRHVGGRTADNTGRLPNLGRTPIRNLFINAGHGPQGWSTSCGSARVVADLVSGLVPAISTAGLGLDRFGRMGGR